MTPTSPSPAVATRTRIKWENLMVVLIAITVVAFGIVGYIAMGASSTTPVEPPADAVAGGAVEATETDMASIEAGALTIDDAMGLVEEARLLMREARWDEAAARLQDVPDELFAAAGASALALELEATRTRYEQLRAEFDAAVQARQWVDAKRLYAELEAIATADDELVASYALVEAGLNPATAASPAAADDVTSPQATGGGGPTTTATKPKPKPKPKPAATTQPKPTAGASGTTGSTSSSSSPQGSSSELNPLAPIELSAQAEAELNAALGFAAGELQ